MEFLLVKNLTKPFTFSGPQIRSILRIQNDHQQILRLSGGYMFGRVINAFLENSFPFNQKNQWTTHKTHICRAAAPLSKNCSR